MDLQQYLHQGLKEMFVGKVLRIQTQRALNTVCVKNVKIVGDLLILETDNYNVNRIELSLGRHEFSSFARHKYSVMFMPGNIDWVNHNSNPLVEVAM